MNQKKKNRKSVEIKEFLFPSKGGLVSKSSAPPTCKRSISATKTVGSSKIAGMMSSKFVSGESNMVLRPITIGVQMTSEGDEKIAQETAYCMFCFAKLEEDDELLRSICGCTTALSHVKCADSRTGILGDFCHYCLKDFRYVAVTLHRAIPASIRSSSTIKKRKWSFFSCLQM